MRVAAALMLSGLLGGVTPAWAARSLPADRPLAVRLELAQPTAVAFPEPIASVSVGLAPERVSLDYDGAYLFLLALDPTVTGRIFVVGQSGTLYPLTFRVVAPADDVVHVTATAPPAPVPAPVAQPMTLATILRALRTGTPLPAQQETDSAPPAIPDTRVALVHMTAHTIDGTLALVLSLQNTQPTPLTLDLRVDVPVQPQEGLVALSTWTWPARLQMRAIAADEETLAPQAQTRVYVLFGRRP
jgi:hypothetical protein